jgi:dTDP-4-amino-4,6-dideoxygalactose transaminase
MTKYDIEFFGLKRQYLDLREELLDASDRVYRTGQVLDGKYTEAFEKAIAQRCERRYAVAVNSGTQALIFAQQALNLYNKKVMIPGVSFVATINSVLLAGNEPVFCDVDHNSLLDINTIDYAMNGQIDAIMYVNLFGNVLDYSALHTAAKFFNEDIKIIEDAAQSFGAKYQGIPSGKLGDISILSFDPTKNLPNYGSGGMILTDDHNLAGLCYDMRNNGKLFDHENIGTNSKMSESDCAQMLVKLKYFDAGQKRRREIAEYYMSELIDYFDIPGPDRDVEHAWHKFVIRLTERHGLQRYLENKGIETKVHYDKTLFDQPVGWDYIDYASDTMRNSTAHTKECLSLPIYPELTNSEIERVVEEIKNYLR